MVMFESPRHIHIWNEFQSLLLSGVPNLLIARERAYSELGVVRLCPRIHMIIFKTYRNNSFLSFD